MNKKIALAMVIVSFGTMAFARPHHGGFYHCGHGFRPAPVYHHYHGGFWGRGGRNFWPGFVGGVVGGVVGSAIYSTPVVTTPTVVTTPVVASPTVVSTPVVSTPVVSTPVVSTPVVTTTPTYVSQQVWVPGRYVDQVQANGTVIRVYQPGHYETRQVVVQ